MFKQPKWRKLAPNVKWNEEDNKIYLVRSDDDQQLSLEGTGAEVWKLVITNGFTVKSAIKQLSKSYNGTSYSVIRDDVEDMLDDLEAKGFITVSTKAPEPDHKNPNPSYPKIMSNVMKKYLYTLVIFCFFVVNMAHAVEWKDPPTPLLRAYSTISLI